MKTLQFFLYFACLNLIQACAFEAEPIQFGQDMCSYCEMKIMDNKFGAVALTKQGRTLKYDAAECLVHHLAEKDAPEIQKTYVVTFSQPATMITTEEAYFVVSDEYRSPMGGNFAAFPLQEQDKHPSAIRKTWSEIRSIFTQH